MKKFLIAVAGIVLVTCIVLRVSFGYPFSLLGFHLIAVGGLVAAVWVLFRFLGYIRNNRLRRISQTTVWFLFFLFLSTFYLVHIGSVATWGKGIELGMLAGYLTSLGSLVETLPVKGWMLYSFLLVFLVFVSILFYFFRPKARQSDPKHLKRDLLVLAGLFVLMWAAYQPLIEFKRHMHAAGEPVLEFLFPRAWHTDVERELFKEVLTNTSDLDKECFAQVRNEPAHVSDRNFLILVIDALRPDHLSAYGYNRPTSPFLDSMIANGKLLKVEYPFSLSTNTLSGMVNLFASKGMQDFSFSALTLVKYMKFKGFRTYAFLTGAQSRWYWQTDLYRNDLDLYYESKSTLEGDDDDFITVEKVTSTRFKAPFFAYVHLMSPHVLGKKHEAFKKFLPDKVGIGGNKSVPLVNNYDNGVLQTDYLIREIFETLKKKGQLQRTTVFIVADHGELLGEDDRWGHNKSVHPNLHAIPMMIYDEDHEWYKNRYSATLLDIAPTIADRLGYPIPPCWHGQSLHKKPVDFSIDLRGTPPCDFPYGILHQKDSIFSMDVMDNDNVQRRRFLFNHESGRWYEEKQ